MNYFVQKLGPQHTRAYLEVHRASVRGIAAYDYPASVIEAWAPAPVTDEAVEIAMANPDGELRVGAFGDGRMVGIGAVVPSLRELRACYVLPEEGWSGVGRMIVAELETIARARGVSVLRLESSVTAFSFYSALGYEIVTRTELVLSSGLPMPAITMRKRL